MVTSNNKSIIRKSTDEDLKIILSWLKDQDESEIQETFYCNRDTIIENHHKGQIIVYIDGVTKEPVAYQFGDLRWSGILEVRFDMRRKGIGRKIVEKRIAQARKTDNGILTVHCMPKSSFPFWQRMGFTSYDRGYGGDYDGIYAYRILDKKFRLPKDSQKIEATIRFFPEMKIHGEEIDSIVDKSPLAVQTSDGIIHLKERIYGFEMIQKGIRDLVIEILINGKRRFFEKAKRTESNDIGVYRCTNGYYIDKINTNFLPNNI